MTDRPSGSPFLTSLQKSQGSRASTLRDLGSGSKPPSALDQDACSASASGTRPDLSGGGVGLLSSAQRTVQAWGQAGLEARMKGKSRGGLKQPLPFVLEPNARLSATVASRDLWTQGQRGDKSGGREIKQRKINQVDR